MTDTVEGLVKEDPASDVASPRRRQMLAWGLSGAAALAIGAFAGTPKADAGIVSFLDKFLDLDAVVANFAFELESLETNFFQRATDSSGFSQLSSVERGVFSRIAMQDAEHRDALDQLRRTHGWQKGGGLSSPNGSNPPFNKQYRFGSAFNSRDSLLKEAVNIKSLALQSYHGSVTHISRSLLAPAAAIAGVEGRHLVVLNEIAGMDPVPSPFEKYTSPQTTGRQLGRYGFEGGDV